MYDDQVGFCARQHQGEPHRVLALCAAFGNLHWNLQPRDSCLGTRKFLRTCRYCHDNFAQTLKGANSLQYTQ